MKELRGTKAAASRLPEHASAPPPPALCRFTHAALQLQTAQRGQRYLLGWPQAQSCDDSLLAGGAAAAAASGASASLIRSSAAEQATES